MSVRIPLLSPPPKPTNSRLKHVLKAGIERDTDLGKQLEQCSIAAKPQRNVVKRTGSSTLSLEEQVYSLGFDIGMPANKPSKKQKTTDGNDPAAAGGDLDDDYQRVQSYYVVSQPKNYEAVLKVMKGWFVGDNRIAFDAMQRAAGLDLKLATNDFYPLISNVQARKGAQKAKAKTGDGASSETVAPAANKKAEGSPPIRKISFDMSCKWYNDFVDGFNEYLRREPTNTWEFEPPGLALRRFINGYISKELKAYVQHEQMYGPQGIDIFCGKLAYEFQVKVNERTAKNEYKHPHLRDGTLSKMYKYTVPAVADSMVFFTGPHMVEGSPIRRMVSYVHSVSDVTAQQLLDKHNQDDMKYTKSVKAMQIPPVAQGKSRSAFVDKYLAEAHNGMWGWGENGGIPNDMRNSLLIDQKSINDAPDAAKAIKDTVAKMRKSMIENSCYVHTGVLANTKQLSAHSLEQHILKCLVTVLDSSLVHHEKLKQQLRDWLAKYEPKSIDGQSPDDVPLETWPWRGIHGFLKLPPSGPNPDNPTHHKNLLEERIKFAKTPMPTSELKEFAINVCLRGHRKATSTTWQKDYKLPNQELEWSADPDTEKLKASKFIRPVQDVEKDLMAAPMNCDPNSHSVADGLLARKDGLKSNKQDLWELVSNLGGNKESVILRYKLYLDGKIAHPHIGAWVSHLKPWCPTLCKPIVWQNVYQVLTKGMFDSHYMPQHQILRHTLKPIIEQMWHATSRREFKKILFPPERFNLRELPKGGEPLQWHIDQDALATPYTADKAPVLEMDTEPSGSFLSDA